MGNPVPAPKRRSELVTRYSVSTYTTVNVLLVLVSTSTARRLSISILPSTLSDHTRENLAADGISEKTIVRVDGGDKREPCDEG